jgi:hypothetical protein
MRSLEILSRSCALLAAVSGCFDSAGGCTNERLVDRASPNGRWHSVVFQRDCGATTGVSTQVSVLPGSDSLLNEGGNAFTADDNHGAAPAVPGGGPPVSTRWIAPDTLEIRFHPRSRVFTREKKVGAVAIRFVTDSTVVP